MDESDKKSKTIIISALILLTLITRFLWLDKTAFFVNDQGRDMMVLYNMVINKKLSLIGPATSFAAKYGNIYFGPYYYYFLLPFYLISKHPYFITSIFPLLFSFGLILLFRLKELKFTEKIIISSLLISSWFSLYYTRFIWNLNLAFLLSFILFNIFLIFHKKITDNCFYTLIFGIVSGSIFQIHYGMFFFFISLLIFFRRSWKNIALYLSGFLISFTPFVLFDIRHGYVISKNIISFIFNFHPQQAVGNFPIIMIFEKIFDYLLFPLINLHPTIKIITAAILYIGVIIFHIRKPNILNRFIALTFIIFLISFSIFKRDFDYYLACFYIWFYFGVGMMMYQFFQNKNWRYIIAITIFVFIIINLYKYFSLPPNVFSLYTQTNIVNTIIKEVKTSQSQKISIQVYPHQDDIKGLAYILLAMFDRTLSSDADNRFYICYYDRCPFPADTKKKIFKTQDVVVYTALP